MYSLPFLKRLSNNKYFVNSLVCKTDAVRYSTAKDDNVLEPVDTPPSFADELIVVPKPASFFNKSGLLTQHRNFLRNERPYKEPHSWIHLTEKYQRKQLGRYGLTSGVNPKICFPTKEEAKKQSELDKIASPYSLQELIERSKNDDNILKEQTRKREEDITNKLEKLAQWKADLNAKIANKEADALAAKQRKDRLVEEVRRHFGFKVDPRDERFKEMLEQKEKEDRKKQKEAKRKAKEDKMMAKLIAKPTVKGTEIESPKK